MATLKQRMSIQKYEASKKQAGERRFAVWLDLHDRVFVESEANRAGVPLATFIRGIVTKARKEAER